MTKQTGRNFLKQDVSPTLVEEERDAKEAHITKKLKSSDTDTRNSENILSEEFRLLHMYWMASNYLAVGQVSIGVPLIIKVTLAHILQLFNNSIFVRRNCRFIFSIRIPC